MSRDRHLPLLMLAALSPVASACGGPEEPEKVCIPGVTQTCSCPGDRVGSQSCTEDGLSFGRCICPNPDAAQPDTGVVDRAQPDSARPDAARADGAGADAGQPDSARPDTASPDTWRPDAGQRDLVLNVDRGTVDTSAADTSAVDASAADTGAHDAGVVDTATRDSTGVDLARADVAQADTLLADVAQPDSAPGIDATLPFDAAGYATLGEPCDLVACLPTLLCTGTSTGGFFCRERCMPGDGTCDPYTEHCINVTSVDGGSCVPGNAPPAPCDVDDPPCADLYICAAPSSSTDWLCRYVCDPSATDAGCPVGTCYRITNQDYGACF